MPARRIGEKALNRAVAMRFANGELVRFLVAHEAEIFGQEHEPRAAAGGFGNQALGFVEVALPIGRADHLQCSDAVRGGEGVSIAHEFKFPMRTATDGTEVA